jgi:transposase-like protein
MPEQRRRFSPQFKAEAVHMVIDTGKPIAAVARDRLSWLLSCLSPCRRALTRRPQRADGGLRRLTRR